MQKAVNLGLIGAGNRGTGTFGQYAIDMPHRAKYTTVVEPHTAKREAFAEQHKIPKEHAFDSLGSFFAADIDLDGIVIATIEDVRLEAVLNSMAKGYHILVEKPLCTTGEGLIEFYDKTVNYDKTLIVCHHMRLSPIYKTMKSLIDSVEFGDIVCIQHSENLSYHHMAHSYVRGFFNNSKLSPMLLAKSCHDLDILTYLTGSKAAKVSSFGNLKYFKKENCPAGAPEYCLDGCPHYQSCPYHALKIYFDDNTDHAYLRQMGVGLEEDKDKRLEVISKNQFGRCVFQCDNNVVDNQTVQIEFENNINASFTMCGHNGIGRRMTKISMTNGEIFYEGDCNDIQTWKFEPELKDTVTVTKKGTHGGGDRAPPSENLWKDTCWYLQQKNRDSTKRLSR
ncbi:MAG: Gfo/Idh/MocA family protein [Planctomycetota bacterium]|jgi:predicted dehydrogenase